MMEKSVLERSQLLINDTNQKERINLEPTGSTTGRQKNINGLSDPSGPEFGNSSTQTVQTAENDGIQQITNNKNVVFENMVGESVDDTLKAFESYNKKKILTQSMMDIALLSANANQLKDLLNNFDNRSVSYVCLALLSISIILQVLVSITILLSIRYNVTNADERKMAIKYSHYVLVGIFLITVINILIPEFGKV